MAKIVVDGKTIIQLIVEEYQRGFGSLTKPDIMAYGMASLRMTHLLEVYLCDEAKRDLISGLNEKDPFVRRCVLFALGCLVLSVAVEPLLTALSDPDPHVRRDAAWGLGPMKDIRAVPPLLRLLKEGQPEEVKNAASTSLSTITGKSFLFGKTSYEKWHNWLQSHKPEIIKG